MSRKVPVPMITGRDPHDDTGPVAGQNIIGGPNRDLLSRDWVPSVAAREAAADFAGFGLAIAFAAAFGLKKVGLNLFGLFGGGKAFNPGVFGGNDHKADPKEGIGSGGKYFQGPAGRFKANLGAHRSSNPMALVFFDGFGPLKLVHALE